MGRSQQETVELTCPDCGRTFQSTIWLIIDGAERPDLLEQILAGSLHAAACPHCGRRGSITAPLLLHDPIGQRLIAALPLSVARREDARALVADLHGRLLQHIPSEQRANYLGSVELAADLDDLRVMLQPPARENQQDDRLSLALEALLAAQSSQAFRDVLVRHRSVLMLPECDTALDEIIDELRRAGAPDAAKRAAEQRALLAQSRAALLRRRQLLQELLDRLAPLADHELAVLGPVRRMLEAVDQQEVYAARLQLGPTEQENADRLLQRLSTLARDANLEEVIDYLSAIQRPLR